MKISSESSCPRRMPMKRCILFFFLFGCSLPEKNYVQPAGTGGCLGRYCSDDAASTGSSETSSAEECDAYVGCMMQCEASNCVALCAEATSSDAGTCEQIRCEALIEACASGDEQACEDVLSCVHSDSSESTSSATGSGESTTTEETLGATMESSSSSDESSASDSSSSTG